MKKLLLLLSMVGLYVNAHADPITLLDTGLPRSSGQLGISETQFLSVSFSLSQQLDNVSISPYLANSAGSPANVAAWLTTAIGTTASSADLVATSSTLNLDSTTFIPTTVFTGLTLSPGMYFLTISSTSTNATNALWAVHCSDPLRCAGAVPLPTDLSYTFIAGPGAPSILDPLNPYASDFLLTPVQPLTFPGIRIQSGGIVPTPIPEPTTLTLLGLGLAGLVGARKLKTK